MNFFFWVYNDALVVVCILLVYTPFISLSVFLTLDKTFFYLVEWPQRMDVFWPILYVSDTPTTLECNIIYLYTNKKTYYTYCTIYRVAKFFVLLVIS